MKYPEIISRWLFAWDRDHERNKSLRLPTSYFFAETEAQWHLPSASTLRVFFIGRGTAVAWINEAYPKCEAVIAKATARRGSLFTKAVAAALSQLCRQHHKLTERDRALIQEIEQHARYFSGKVS